MMKAEDAFEGYTTTRPNPIWAHRWAHRPDVSLIPPWT